MPKQKSHRGAAKRFSFTKTGIVKRIDQCAVQIKQYPSYHADASIQEKNGCSSQPYKYYAFTISTSFAKPAGSFTARSASILRFISMFFFFRPFMKVE